jgi:PAS domain
VPEIIYLPKGLDACLSLCDAPMEALSEDRVPEGHPVFLFREYWNSLNGGKLPGRTAFHPTHLPRLLPYIMLLEEGDSAHMGDYRLRLHGTAMVALSRGDFTGQYLSEFVKNTCLESRLLAIATAIEIGSPVFGCTILGDDSEFSRSVIIGAFPFKCSSGRHQIFMVGAPGD